MDKIKYEQHLNFCKKHYYKKGKDREYYLSLYKGMLPRIITCFVDPISHLDFDLVKKSNNEFIGYSKNLIPVKIYHSVSKLWLKNVFRVKIIFAETSFGIKPVHLIDIF